MFTVTIKTDNSAFDDGNAQAELSRILRRIADQVQDGAEHGKCKDINGNTVGEFCCND